MSSDRGLPVFTRDLTEPTPIPADGIARAVALMETGRLFRYGEMGADQLDTALLEAEFAAFLGRRFCIAVNSGGSALFLALKVLDVKPGDPVLVNGFTLAPVPGAIVHAGAVPVIVDVTDDYVIDLADLERKARASGARVLLLSHMRGHIADMAEVVALCTRLGLELIEDCAHALCAGWDGRTAGTFGAAAAFSAQTYKHLNAGEGGFLVLDDEDRAARAILHSGSYMLHAQHKSAPAPAVMARWSETTPNFSLRMTALAAALLRPQLALLPERARRWNVIYAAIAARLMDSNRIRLPHRPAAEAFSATSVQFSLPGFSPEAMADFVARAGARGVPVKWFGAARQAGFTSAPRHWLYAGAQGPLTATHDVLATLCDVRTPVSLTDADCRLIGDILVTCAEQAAPPCLPPQETTNPEPAARTPVTAASRRK